ncbi:MAG: FGGY-family carbohydrate kinase [Chloroflexota bacterium]|nr:FGGY-family carbohydrate kinase [Chloroflexota bacterium]
MSLAGLDIGTTGCKAVVITTEGAVLGKAGREYKLSVPQPGWAELDSEEVWAAVQDVLRDVAAATHADPVEAISVSAMADTVTPFDQDINPLAASIVSFDARSAAETQEICNLVGREWLFQTTGMPPHSTHSATKILWLKNHRPGLFRQTRWFLCYEDFVLAKLGAEPAISTSNAARMMMLDLGRLTWQPQLLEICSISPEQLAAPTQSGVMVGEIDRQLAAELGLRPEVKLVSGGHDQPCAALGSGIVSEGMALDTTGTVEVLLVTFQEPLLDQAMLDGYLCCYPHAYPDRYCSFAQLQGAGAAFRWFRDRLGHEEVVEALPARADPYDLIVSKLPRQPTGLFVLPYLAGSGTPTMNPAAKGSIYGLTLNTDKYDLARAILEGVTYELKTNIDLFESTGTKIEAIKAAGGGARSDFWLQLKADITGRVIEANQQTEASALGAAILAGYGLGCYSTLEEGIKAVESPTRAFHPDAETHARYQEDFAKYVVYREAMSDLYSSLS